MAAAVAAVGVGAVVGAGVFAATGVGIGAAIIAVASVTLWARVSPRHLAVSPGRSHATSPGQHKAKKPSCQLAHLDPKAPHPVCKVAGTLCCLGMTGGRPWGHHILVNKTDTRTAAHEKSDVNVFKAFMLGNTRAGTTTHPCPAPIVQRPLVTSMHSPQALGSQGFTWGWGGGGGLGAPFPTPLPPWRHIFHAYFMRLVESKLLQNLYDGISPDFPLKVRVLHDNAIVQKKVGTTRPNFEQKRRSLMALGPSAGSGGFRCISLLHTCAPARSPRLAKARQGMAGMV